MAIQKSTFLRIRSSTENFKGVPGSAVTSFEIQGAASGMSNRRRAILKFMMSNHFKETGWLGKAVLVGAAWLQVTSAFAVEPPLRLMIDRPPATLNPRRASDAAGQRLGALIFRALTRIDSEQLP